MSPRSAFNTALGATVSSTRTVEKRREKVGRRVRRSSCIASARRKLWKGRSCRQNCALEGCVFRTCLRVFSRAEAQPINTTRAEWRSYSGHSAQSRSTLSVERRFLAGSISKRTSKTWMPGTYNRYRAIFSDDRVLEFLRAPCRGHTLSYFLRGLNYSLTRVRTEKKLTALHFGPATNVENLRRS